MPSANISMNIRNDDIYQEVRRRYKSRDWSVTFLWISLFLSLTMVTGTMMWNLGKSMRVESYLKDHSIETCQALHRPPALMDDSDQSASVLGSCERIVSQRHDRCLDRTQYLRENLKQRRADYMTCIMEHDFQQAALTEKDESAH